MTRSGAAFLTMSRVRDDYFKWRVDVPASAPPDAVKKVQELVDALVPK